MGEPVGGNVAVEKRITLNLRVDVNEPQTQSGSSCEHGQGEQRGHATASHKMDTQSFQTGLMFGARLSPLFQATLKVMRVFRLQSGAKVADGKGA